MFVNQAKLPHVLAPKLYWDADQYELEKRRIFEPAWHLVGPVKQIPNDGDFLTREVLGRPLIVRHFRGENCAFLNVCPHRHSLLTDQPTGHSPTLKCQYHGWEFDKNGNTGRIPDAKSFRPLTGGPECLTKYATRTVGPLIFTTFQSEGTQFNELHPEVSAIVDEYEVDRWCLADHWAYSFAANWKVVVENTVETYHADAVHPHTLAFGSGEGDIEHVIHDDGTVLRANLINSKRYYQLADLILARLQPGCSHQYRLHHLFPNLFLIRIDAMLQVMTVMPTSPTTCTMDVSVFILRAEQQSFIDRLLVKAWGALKCRVIKQILSEDAALYPSIQRGVQVSPFKGMISAREELVHAFQRYVARTCGLVDEKA